MCDFDVCRVLPESSLRYLRAVKNWANSLTSLSLSFQTYKMGLVFVATSYSFVKK